MTRYVSLACDNNPAYSIWAPIMTRLWRHLGYTPIVFLHNEGWSNELGNLVMAILEQEHARGETVLVPISRIGPLSIANTMRVSRLAAAALDVVKPEDFVLTSDIDMAPLSRTFFHRDPSKCWILRADMYGSLEGASQIMHDGTKGLISGLWRFPLCYIGLPVVAWRTIMPLVLGDPERSLRNINHGLRHDSHDHDEACTSARLLLSHWAAGSMVRQANPHIQPEDAEHWIQGQLNLVGLINGPKGTQRHMLLGGMARQYDPKAIDWHIKSTGLWIGDALAQWWPEERDFLREYWPTACKAIGVHT